MDENIRQIQGHFSAAREWLEVAENAIANENFLLAAEALGKANQLTRDAEIDIARVWKVPR